MNTMRTMSFDPDFGKIQGKWRIYYRGTNDVSSCGRKIWRLVDAVVLQGLWCRFQRFCSVVSSACFTKTFFIFS